MAELRLPADRLEIPVELEIPPAAAVRVRPSGPPRTVHNIAIRPTAAALSGRAAVDIG
ncbi:hypothetical protein GCM10010324_63510 [Streptomyces hiroshimensis]|uniref:Uncharacterized protein n=1 Tax=Streptomyces hiroshimensis TaxID=66424 RepID=A0ABQ2Z9R4_9ACTN|nr:hypothetical protein GCM10010324_63510 [Streptomyces hiroshimensis]